MAFIECNSRHFAIVDGSLHQSYVPLQSQPLRLTGVTLRDNDPSIGHSVFPSFPQGIGWTRLNRNNGRGVGGLRDATVDTRFLPATLGRLHESQTHADPAQHPKAYVNFLGDFWGIFEEDYDSGETTDVLCRVFGATSDNWTGGGTVVSGGTSAAGVRAWHATVHKGTIVVLATRSDAELSMTVWKSSDGASFTEYSNDPTGAWSTTTSRRNNFDDDIGKILDFGELLIVAGLTEATPQVNLRSTDDAGATAWVNQGFITGDSHIHALLKWRDPTDLTTIIPIVVTENNVYKIDTTNNAVTALLPQGVLTGDANDGRGATVGQDGNLYLPLGTGDILKVRLVGENAFDIVRIGPPGDGLVTARRGHANFLLAPAAPWLIAAYGGHAAGQQASIWYVDYDPQRDPETGKDFHAWHSGYLESDANIDLYLLGYSTEDDATPRLHFALEHATDAEMFHIEEPFTHPLASTTIKYQAESYLRLPTDDLGDPHATATFYTARVDADDLTAGGGGSGSNGVDDYITLQYGLDGAVDTTTTLGDFLSGQLSLNFGGASGIGVSGRKIAIRLRFRRQQSATDTETPHLLEFELLASNRLVFKRLWSMRIDIEVTASEYAGDFTLAAGQQAQEAIIAALETIAESTTLLAFIAGQLSSTTRVEVPNDKPVQFDLRVVGSSGEQAGYRTGFADLVVQEVR